MRILMVMAHPDDEIIFGFPITQDTKDNEVSLVTLSHNRARHGTGPITALQEVSRILNIQLLELPRVENNFYRLAPRFEKRLLSEAFNLLRNNINKAISLSKPDYIFTHNPMGEYGHGDHRFTFNVVSEFDVPLMLTDICFATACHLSSDSIPKIYRDNLYSQRQGTRYELDLNWYNRMEAIYKKHGAWSWSGQNPITSCRLFSF